jgi:AraC-like DNA-binding protein
VIDVDRVFGAEAAELESRLYDHLAQPEEQASLLDKFLPGRLALDYRTGLALHIAGRIAGSGGQINLRLLSREIGYSPRHLDRIFQQCLGISPNFYRRIARFQKALQLLVADPGIELVELVEACGYYDQPHLSKEFSEFAGQSPNQHRAHLIAKIAGPTPPNLVQFLQDVPVGA